MPYRLEVSPTARAGCTNTACKSEGIKIGKGELRFGVLVELPNVGPSWRWKHWGCVTPQQVGNLVKESENDPHLVDGYDELPANFQDVVRGALEQGHVSDSDWRGDPEMNRPGKKGYRTPKKDKKKEAHSEADHEASPSKAASKKRSRAKAQHVDSDEDDVESKPPSKKTRGKSAKSKKQSADADSEAPAPPAKARGRPKKMKREAEEHAEDGEISTTAQLKDGKGGADADINDDAPENPAPKKTKSRRAAAKKADHNRSKEDDDGGEQPGEPVKSKRGRKKGRQ